MNRNKVRRRRLTLRFLQFTPVVRSDAGLFAAMINPSADERQAQVSGSSLEEVEILPKGTGDLRPEGGGWR